MTFPIIIHKVEVNKKFVVALMLYNNIMCRLLLVGKCWHAVIKHHNLP